MLQSQPASVLMRGAILALALSAFASVTGHTQGAAPFANLAGRWSGAGTIDLANGAHEPIKCHAAYDVLGEQRNLQLNLRCASDSYNFDLRASATYAAGAISGTWSEATRNAAGTLSGKADGVNFRVLAKGPTFTANLSLVTHGNKQSVVIKSQDAEASVKGATIALQRS